MKNQICCCEVCEKLSTWFIATEPFGPDDFTYSCDTHLAVMVDAEGWSHIRPVNSDDLVGDGEAQ